ncbi:MAG: HAD hydrolase-like protein [Clostridia bacterium]|nr:HAD hydrolase-like protein [Clostridia bacterium]
MNKYFIGIDSDGTAFDSMTIKHTKAFIPVFIEIWGYEEYSDKIKEICEHINLYSKTRGIDRFSGLEITFREIEKCGIKVPDYSGLSGFLKSGKLSNESLRKYLKTNDDEFLKNVLIWSEKADELFKKEVKALQPFKSVKKVLIKSQGIADTAVISSASESSLREDWQKDNLTEYVTAIYGQEFGNKKAQLENAMKKGYEKALMIGDALGDLEAAKSVGALFYPIIPGSEDASWELLCDKYLDMFFKNEFNEKVQQKLIFELLDIIGE